MYDELKMSIDRGQLPDGDVVRLKNRLPGHPVTWRTCRLNRRPPKLDQIKWAMRWNPFRQCSWPPEDVAIERFRTHVKDHALSILGNDLARSEKFTTSLKDGLDIRETLRNWHTGDLYVKVFPPNRGSLDCVIMLFDSPADPRDYPWRITWHAEAHDESTLSFFATRFEQELVGPGIALATYGGAMFLFPPRPIEDIWRDRQFYFTDTLEERLLGAALIAGGSAKKGDVLGIAGGGLRTPVPMQQRGDACFVQLRAAPGWAAKLVEEVAGLEDVSAVALVAGPFDLIVELPYPWEQSARVIVDRIMPLEGIETVRTLVAIPFLEPEEPDRDQFSAWS